jgi:hypothetical protein
MMRYLLVMVLLLLTPPRPAEAQVTLQIGLPSVTIGFEQVEYPQLIAVPGYPVYYDPNATTNYFFYDGLYWVYEGDTWYASSWFNGPWDVVEPEGVPFFILRVPVNYYRQPPRYFRSWRADEAPHWGERWGQDWERQRSGWDRWDRRSTPPAAPLPAYQRQYAGSRYPRADQQQTLRSQNYRHDSSDAAVTRVHQAQVQRAAQPAAPAKEPGRAATAQPPRQERPQAREQHDQAPPPKKAPPPERPQASQPQRAAPAKPPATEPPQAREQHDQASPPKKGPPPERPQASEPQRAAPAKPPATERPQAREQHDQAPPPRQGPPPERPQAMEPQRAAPAQPPAQERPQAKAQHDQAPPPKKDPPPERGRETDKPKGDDRGRQHDDSSEGGAAGQRHA